MITSYYDFINKFNLHVFNAWNSKAIKDVAEKREIRFANQEFVKPDSNSYWIKVNTQIVRDEQKTLSSCVGEPYGRRYQVDGFCVIQIFAPKHIHNSNNSAMVIANELKNAFRRSNESQDIWFREARLSEMQPELEYYRYNVVVEFQFDEFY